MARDVAKRHATPVGTMLGAMEVTMSYKLTITHKPTYMHVIVTGLNTKENVERYLEEIWRECTAVGCFRVLIEERLDGPRLGLMDVFQIAAEGSSRARGYFQAIAYVDRNAQDDLMNFAETVAANRSLPISVFLSVSDAESWLLGTDREGTPQGTPANTEKPRG